MHVLVAVLEQPQHVAHRAALAQVLAERRGERALGLVDQRREVAERVELRLLVGRRDRGDEDVDGVGHLGREGGDVGHLRNASPAKNCCRKCNCLAKLGSNWCGRARVALDRREPSGEEISLQLRNRSARAVRREPAQSCRPSLRNSEMSDSDDLFGSDDGIEELLDLP